MKRYKYPVLNQKEWAYITGLFDGEGTVNISVTNRPKRSQVYTLRLKIANTNFNVIKWLEAKLNGWSDTDRRRYKYKNINNKHKYCYAWVITGYRAKYILEKMLPFTIIKIKQIELGIKFQDYKNRHYKHSKQGILANELVKLANFKYKLSILNGGRNVKNS